MPQHLGLPIWLVADILTEEIRETHDMHPRYVKCCLNSTVKQWRERLSDDDWQDVWQRVRRQLHDYRYLVSSFRDRERIKRKKQRWAARLSAMPHLERQALYAALSEVL